MNEDIFAIGMSLAVAVAVMWIGLAICFSCGNMYRWFGNSFIVMLNISCILIWSSFLFGRNK